MLALIYTLIATHITILCVTIYLHRSQAHRTVTINPKLAHVMRFWLWLTTGMVTKQWVAVHRKHHRYCEETGDPHSPVVYGLRKVLFSGALLYNEAARDKSMVDVYGAGTPDDWIERRLYTPYSRLGIGICLLLDLWLFGAWGALVWIIQMIWIPFWAAGVVNGLAHYWGYRNFSTRDNSRNISPFGIIIGGEELHNNHHENPNSAKLSRTKYEFDIGWMWIRILEKIKLAEIRSI